MSVIHDVEREVTASLQTAAKIAPKLAQLTMEQKNRALVAMSDALLRRRYAILEANRHDVASSTANGDDGARVERLTLTESRIHDMVTALRQIAELPDPIGEVVESFERPNGLHIDKVRVPMGVIAVIYESRPNVTVDSAALALKTGNAVILRGGKEALLSNQALVDALREGLETAGVSAPAIQLITNVDRRAVDIILHADKWVDLAIPRGGAGLIQHVKEVARVPVIETGVGNCHVFIERQADLEMAAQIVMNAKTQRPSVCNAMETLLVDAPVVDQNAEWFLQLLKDLRRVGVELRLDERSLALWKQSEAPLEGISPATEDDYRTEFLALVLAVKVVHGLDEAIEHIAAYGTKHSEAIVTQDDTAANRFISAVDAAAVYHNASTRFTDGFEFGFGAEIGISTQKLHARGPMGLRELCSYKYIIRGNGQVR